MFKIKFRWPFVDYRRYNKLLVENYHLQEQLKRQNIMELNIPVSLPFNPKKHNKSSIYENDLGMGIVKLYGTEEDVELFQQALKHYPK